MKSEVRDGIMAIFQCFEPPLDDPVPPVQNSEFDDSLPTKFLMLSALDIIGLMQTLYPERPHVQGTKESQEVDVAPPSTAGSSTLNASTSDAGSALASSFAPSTSGTSATSRTVLSEMQRNDWLAENQDTQEAFQVEHGSGPSKTYNFRKPELRSPLKSICRRLTDLLGPGGTSALDFSHTAWAFVYYSRNGTTLSLSPTELRKNRGHTTMDSTGDFDFLKAGIVKLLGQIDRSKTITLGSPIMVDSTHASDQPDPLVDLMKACEDNARSSLDFSMAYFWWQIHGVYCEFLASAGSPTASLSLLRSIADDLRRKLGAITDAGKTSEVRLRSLERLRRHQTSLLAKMEEEQKALRVKMWYSSDVRHSATYEEALHVTRALRAMTNSKRAAQPASTANWARQRLRGSGTLARPEAQILEAISAPKDYGGQSKLADEQVDLTSKWLTRRSIENFCKGEERIHRFCFEIQKSVGKMAGPSPTRNPVLWSSNLFRREKAIFDAQHLISGAHTASFSAPTRLTPSSSLYEPGRLQAAALHPSDPLIKAFGSPKAKTTSNSFGGFWNATQPSASSIGLGLHGTHPLLPPTPTSPPRSWSSNPFNSSPPLHGTVPSATNPIFGDRTSQSNQEAEYSPARIAFAESMKMTLRSLLISDLGCSLWEQGSETDAWVNDCVKYQTLEPEAAANLARRDNSTETGSHQDATKTRSFSSLHRSSFPFTTAYAMLLQKMSLSSDPRAKLQTLYELEDLIIRSMQASSTFRLTSDTVNRGSRQRISHEDFGLRGKSVPRTKTTSLEEVIANCTERRASTLRPMGRHHAFSQPTSQPIPTDAHIPATEDVVDTFLSIFRDPKLRSSTLFRDLQYIAAFIPSETLDQTVQGNAFWDAGLAALALKEDLCESIITRANQITAYHISSSKSTHPLVDSTLANTTLRDAANLWLITAKEGSPVAARELGLFYLTHPELLPRITMPFSTAQDVYKSVLSIDARNSDKDKGALDRTTFAVVFHWMEFAANGGDRDARDFLKGNGVLSGGR